MTSLLESLPFTFDADSDVKNPSEEELSTQIANVAHTIDRIYHKVNNTSVYTYGGNDSHSSTVYCIRSDGGLSSNRRMVASSYMVVGREAELESYNKTLKQYAQLSLLLAHKYKQLRGLLKHAQVRSTKTHVPSTAGIGPCPQFKYQGTRIIAGSRSTSSAIDKNIGLYVWSNGYQSNKQTTLRITDLSESAFDKFKQMVAQVNRMLNLTGPDQIGWVRQEICTSNPSSPYIQLYASASTGKVVMFTNNVPKRANDPVTVVYGPYTDRTSELYSQFMVQDVNHARHIADQYDPSEGN